MQLKRMNNMTLQEYINLYQRINCSLRLNSEQLREIEQEFSPKIDRSVIERALKDDKNFQYFAKKQHSIACQPNRIAKGAQVPDLLHLTAIYAEKMLKFVLTFSEEKEDYNKAKEEWVLVKVIVNESGSKCDMCKDATITYEFEIENSLNGRKFWIGCDCIRNYMSVNMYRLALKLKDIFINMRKSDENITSLSLKDCPETELKKKRSKKLQPTYCRVRTHCSSIRPDGSSEGLTIIRSQLKKNLFTFKTSEVPKHGVMTFLYNSKEGVCTINNRGAYIDIKEVKRLGLPAINMGHTKRTGERIVLDIAMTRVYNVKREEVVKLKNKILKKLIEKEKNKK